MNVYQGGATNVYKYSHLIALLCGRPDDSMEISEKAGARWAGTLITIAKHFLNALQISGSNN
jgi:hypothetical protein